MDVLKIFTNDPVKRTPKELFRQTTRQTKRRDAIHLFISFDGIATHLLP